MSKNNSTTAWAAMFIVFLPLFSLAAGADGGAEDMSRVASMDELIARIQLKYQGSILKVELISGKDAPGWRYKVKMLPPDGNVMKLEYDAETLELLNIEGERRNNKEYQESYWKKLMD